MKVEIWSDVMCPFCYIGKRRFEEALAQFDHSEDIRVEWKSFQLQPNLQSRPDKNMADHLAQTKGWSTEQIAQMQQRIIDMASDAGLEFNFEDAVVANSLDAHRLAHFAKSQDKGGAAEETLFKAHFTDGKNIDDVEVLTALAESIGLDAEKTRNILKGDQYTKAVKDDIRESQKVGVQGVPFFVFNREYAVSGAQPTQAFLEALQKSWKEWNSQQQPATLDSATGDVTCGPDGNC